MDEIGDVPLEMQPKLLRVLQEREFERLGSNRTINADIRLIAATNRDLAEMVDSGTFRSDLFYRLNVFPVQVPPLRERRDDIPLLVRYFVRKFAARLRRDITSIPAATMSMLQEWHWPGNIRELENILQRLVVMTDTEEIDAADLPSLMRFAVPLDGGLQRTLAEVEANHIRAVLASVKGNKTQAAQILGIDRKTLRENLKRFGFSSEANAPEEAD